MIYLGLNISYKKFMNIEIITAPLIGAIIGYITNDLAIRMLFHPRKAVYIGKFRLPFTPGIIPKEHPAIARALGTVVSERLLDCDTLRRTLLSDEIVGKLEKRIDSLIAQNEASDKTIMELLCDYFEKDSIINCKNNLTEKAALKIKEYAVSQNVGRLLTEHFLEYMSGEEHGSLAGFIVPLIGDKVKNSISSLINDYVENNIESISRSIIAEKSDELMQTKHGDMLANNRELTETLKQKVIGLYKYFVEEKLDSVLQSVNIEKIVEDKILEFDAAQLESLIFGIMKRELRMVVNLGAFLGMLMGALNLLM